MTQKKPKSEKRQRTCIISVRATPAEKQLISDDAAACGLTVSGYLLQLASNAPAPRQRHVSSPDIQMLEKARADLNRYGNLLNQLVKLGHQGIIPPLPELEEALRSCVKANEKLIEAVGKRPNKTAANKTPSEKLTEHFS